MEYLVIDLEMCKVPKHYRTKTYQYANEIIQIGAVLLNEEFEIIERMNQYVHPKYGVMNHFISNLTGIQNNQVKNAKSLKEVLNDLIDRIENREYKIYAWSISDYNQLQSEICSKEIEDEKITHFMDSERWVDYQAVFGKRFNFSRAVSLEEALICCNIDVVGRLHDGLDDAENTAKLIKTLELDKEFVLCNSIIDNTEDSKPLGVSMGELFSGFNFGNIT